LPVLKETYLGTGSLYLNRKSSSNTLRNDSFLPLDTVTRGLLEPEIDAGSCPGNADFPTYHLKPCKKYNRFTFQKATGKAGLFSMRETAFPADGGQH